MIDLFSPAGRRFSTYSRFHSQAKNASITEAQNDIKALLLNSLMENAFIPAYDFSRMRLQGLV
jgi:hypothetical protein